jgi:F-type H+-transporting ATPase subunit epsilon
MIHVDVVTPTRKLVDGAKVSELRLPSVKGELQVLPGHTELLTLLGTGILAFHQGGKERKFSVSLGFAEIRDDRVLVLAETCEEATDIDKNRAVAAKEKAEEELTGTLTPERFRKYEMKLQRAVTRIKIAN